MSELVSYQVEGKVAVATMDDGKANALSLAMIEQVMAAIARAEQDGHALVLAGRPERFCGGFDLRVMMSGPANAVELLKTGSGLLLALYGARVPIIIACTGHAIAGGALVVLTGDHRICAAGDFKIGLNEVSIGLPVPVLAMELARDRLTASALPYATLAATIYNPAQAVVAGYVDEVVPADEVLARAKATAACYAGFSASAYQATKKRLRGKTIEYIRNTMDADLRELLPAPA